MANKIFPVENGELVTNEDPENKKLVVTFAKKITNLNAGHPQQNKGDIHNLQIDQKLTKPSSENENHNFFNQTKTNPVFTRSRFDSVSANHQICNI